MAGSAQYATQLQPAALCGDVLCHSNAVESIIFVAGVAELEVGHDDVGKRGGILPPRQKVRCGVSDVDDINVLFGANQRGSA